MFDYATTADDDSKSVDVGNIDRFRVGVAACNMDGNDSGLAMGDTVADIGELSSASQSVMALG